MDIKKESLETIKELYFKCGGDENLEHLYILPSKLIDLLKYESISDEIYENLQNASCKPVQFFVGEISTVGIPKPTVLVIIYRVFIWLLSFKNAGEKSIIRMQSFEMLVQEKGQDHIIKKVITMELLRRLLIMKRHPNLRKVSEQISMLNSTHV